MADWQAGDLALCVRDGVLPKSRWRRSWLGPGNVKAGGIYTVRAVGINRYGSPALWLDGFPIGYRRDRFLKITPGAKIEGIEEPRRVKVGA